MEKLPEKLMLLGFDLTMYYDVFEVKCKYLRKKSKNLDSEDEIIKLSEILAP